MNFRERQSFDLEKKEIMDTFASHIALLLHIKESISREETAYLAQDLHDVLDILSLNVVNSTGRVIDKLRKRQHVAASQLVKNVLDTAKYCVEEIRTVMGMLINHVVDDLGLSAALESYFELSRPPGLKVNFTMEGNGKLSKGIERHLYRIALGLFNNVIAHSHASHVKISLCIGPKQTTLAVVDNGKGFNRRTALQRKGKYGLLGIRRRVKEVLKGRVAIQSGVGKGTRVRIAIPRSGAVYEEGKKTTTTT